MMYETILRSDCCQAPVIELHPDWDDNGEFELWSCSKCKRNCAPEEVCAHCMGTGKVEQANGPDDYETVRCVCQLD